MKQIHKLTHAVLFFCLLNSAIYSQEKKEVSIKISLNAAELAFQHQLFNEKTWGEVFIGVANQDINNQFDDLMGGIRMGHTILEKGRNHIDLQVGTGIYKATNDYYKAIAPFAEAGVRYVRHLGQTGRHNLLVASGLRIGQRDYKQNYRTEWFEAKTTGTMKLAPLVFSVGYAYKF